MRPVFLITAFCLLTAATAPAIDFISTNRYELAKEQSVDTEQWISAEVIQIDGTLRQDLFAGGIKDLVLNGICEQAVWAMAGNSMVITGDCHDNVRLLGTTIRIDGTIDGNLMAVANAISIGTNAVIAGDVHLNANQIILEGSVGGSVDLTATQTATLSGIITGNAKVHAHEIILSDNAAKIGGNLTYMSSRELIPGENVIGGTIKRSEPPSPYSADRLYSHAIWFLAAFLTGMPFVSLFPMTTAMASILTRKSPLLCLLVGFVAFFLLPILGVIALSSGIGIPLGALMLASWGALVYISRIITGLLIGTLILRNGTTSAGRIILSMSAGLAVIYSVTFIPTAFSLLFQLVVIWIGTGALLLALHQKRRLIIQVPEELRQLEALKNKTPNTMEESP
ncbi:MAG: polymer-forming cytoskeletal protein [Pontiellaceae bacterium]|nr:polymer-forming cytoskeletal protein [Pontiellaceae bacterium]MBN2784270.1 polymer-forming cytoskeletal protein [Pontiellaceae bacterium]